jgi:Fe-S-cluster containining protein
MGNKLTKINTIIDSDRPIELHRLSNNKYRFGFCSRCGACCKSININTTASDNVIHWLNGYGITTNIKSNIFNSPECSKEKVHTVGLSIPIICKFLENGVDGQYSCSRYNKDIPVICKGYPKAQSAFSSCTFIFITTDELKIVLNKINQWEETNGKTKTIINV